LAYRQKLQDPRWQTIRLYVFERPSERPVLFGDSVIITPTIPDQIPHDRVVTASLSFVRPNTPLAVHHNTYAAGNEPWNDPLECFITVCQKCQDATHGIAEKRTRLVEGGLYSWASLPPLLGFKPHGYLAEDGDHILCGCFRLDYNPDAPRILLAGQNDRGTRQARLFARQPKPVPDFIKALAALWKYCGFQAHAPGAFVGNFVESPRIRGSSCQRP
jgi:hypothetical protein